MIYNLQTKIDKLPDGYVFTYKEVCDGASNTEATIKALNRKVANGQLQKLAKGKFYKEKQSIFGGLKPFEEEIIKDLFEKDGKSIGYLTGLSLFNVYGLTTQVSNTFEIGRNDIKPRLQRGFYKFKFLLQKNKITKENIVYLQLLDAMRLIKKIPDGDNVQAINRFIAIVKKIEDKELKILVKLCKTYPANTRALLGAILDKLGKKLFASELKATLNPITKYKLIDVNKALNNATNWNFI